MQVILNCTDFKTFLQDTYFCEIKANSRSFYSSSGSPLAPAFESGASGAVVSVNEDSQVSNFILYRLQYIYKQDTFFSQIRADMP